MRLSARLICLAALTAASPLVLAGNLYQWKDAQGVTHYSDRPPSDSDLKGRRIDARDSLARGETPAVAAPAESPQCTTAKLNQKLLAGNAPVRKAGADGKPGEVLGEEERGSQRALADAAIKAYCKPAG